MEYEESLQSYIEAIVNKVEALEEMLCNLAGLLAVKNVISEEDHAALLDGVEYQFGADEDDDLPNN